MNAPLTAAVTQRALFSPQVPALLALADGTVFRGRSIGAIGRAIGEVVFNTAMTGYEEILTDPSYAGQIVTLTYPHIGNVGINPEDVESRRIFAAGLVIRDLPALASNWRRTQDLGTFLASANMVGVAQIDTRKLVRMLREKGAQNGCIVAAPELSSIWRRMCPAPNATIGRRAHGRSAPVIALSARQRSMSSPTISASSTTFCGCSRSAAAS